MKLWLVLVACSAMQASCSSRPLTEVECQLITDKEIQYAVASLPADEAESMRSHLLKSSSGGVDRCIAGATYRRDDYKCMIKAKTPNGIGQCITVVNKRIGR